MINILFTFNITLILPHSRLRIKKCDFVRHYVPNKNDTVMKKKNLKPAYHTRLCGGQCFLFQDKLSRKSKLQYPFVIVASFPL